MNADPIFTAVEQLRGVAGDGAARRKALDALFRHVHNLKANASANGLNDLAAAAHDFENVLHAMRTGATDLLASTAIPADLWSSLKQDQKYTLQQSLAEGARLFLVEANFDVADFDREFQNLKETLSKTGELISTSPSINNATPGKVNFKILYAQKSEAALANSAEVTVREISPSLTANSLQGRNDLKTFERSFEKLSAELANLPATPFGDVFERALRAGRSAAAATGKEVDFEVRGQYQTRDNTLREIFADSLVHLVRNAVDHGIEGSDERIRLGKKPRGKIVIETATVDEQVKITVTDDGRGIDAALIHQIFRPGFSTASEVSDISGRGVGLDAVKTAIEEAGGSFSVSSEAGQGSTFAIVFPSNER